MASVSGQGTTFNLPNYIGELFHLTPSETPFLSMTGSLTGGLRTKSTMFTWQTDDNAAASQPAILEGADPVYSERDRSQVKNVVQIHQEGVEVSYRKQNATGQLDGESILGTQPVQDEMQRQRMIKLMQVGRDVEYSLLQGVFQEPADNTTAYKTRGMTNAVTTNTVDASTYSSTQLTKEKIDDLLETMFNNGAPFMQPVIIVNGYQKRKISEVYGYAPESRTIGGVSVDQILTDFAGLVGVVLDRHQPSAELLVAEVSVCAPVILDGPNTPPPFSFEPMAKTNAADKEQLYGEIGLMYGPEVFHGKISNLATS